MKVLYFISTLGHGRGGHFYSAKTITKALSSQITPVFINIGLKESPIINSLEPEIKVYNVFFNGYNFLKALKRIFKIIKNEQPNIIHSYDSRAFIFSFFSGRKYKTPCVITKCGGPNDKRLPYSHDLILFSEENKQFYENNIEFAKTNIYLIPNRVTKINADNNRILKLKEKVVNIDEAKVFLRIGRIDNHYKNTIKQSINLTKKLNSEGIKSVLIIIGAIQNRVIYDELKDFSDENIYYFTENEYTINSSELINIADYVIGSGRGLMEATSLSKIILTPYLGSQYPLLLTNDNFNDIFNANFSPRARIKNFNENENYEAIKEVVLNSQLQKRQAEFSLSLFEKYFNIESKIDDYIEIYKSLAYTKMKLKYSHFYNTLYTIYQFIKARKK